MNIINELTKLKNEKINYCFYLEQDGTPTLDRYNENSRNIEIYIEQRSNPKLTNVFFEGISDASPILKGAIKFLISFDDKLKEAKLKLDNNPKVTLGEYLDNYSENGFPKFLYHGTSLDKIDSIMKDGILPRATTNVDPQYKSIQSGESNESLIYLCTHGTIGSAKFAARQAASNNQSKPIIIKIDTQEIDFNLLKPDEDSNCQTWKDSLFKMGAIAYNGSIKPSKISIEYELTKSMNSISDFLEKYSTKEQKSLKNNKKNMI